MKPKLNFLGNGSHVTMTLKSMICTAHGCSHFLCRGAKSEIYVPREKHSTIDSRHSMRGPVTRSGTGCKTSNITGNVSMVPKKGEKIMHAMKPYMILTT